MLWILEINYRSLYFFMMSSIGDLQKYHQFNAILARKTNKTFVLQILNNKYANSCIFLLLIQLKPYRVEIILI